LHLHGLRYGIDSDGVAARRSQNGARSDDIHPGSN
jgi:hypothetical protein